MLHVINGDGAAAAFAEAGGRGEVLVWREALAADPRGLDALAERRDPALPATAFALDLHRQRFPDSRTGLGRTQRGYLELLLDGAGDFAEFLRAFSQAEPGYGWGDRQVWDELRDLARCEHPLLSMETAGASEPAAQARLRVTDTGERVLAGEVDHVALNGMDQWLGGVHLRAPSSTWRWDSATGRIIDAS